MWIKLLLALVGGVGFIALVAWIVKHFEASIAPPVSGPTPAEQKIVDQTKADVSDLDAKRAAIPTEVANETLEQVVDGLNGGAGTSSDD